MSKYSPEFRADAVALYQASPGGTYASVAKDVGVNHEMLRIWVRDAEAVAPPGALAVTAMETWAGSSSRFPRRGVLVVVERSG